MTEPKETESPDSTEALTETQKALTIASGEPDVESLKTAYDQTLSDLGYFIEGISDGYNWRRNIWQGKSRDLRKHGGNAFPWEGAADNEAHVISQRIDTYIALFMGALQRANIRANPVAVNDLRRARLTSAFLKWMVASYIPQFKRHMEIGGNNLLERGIMITYVGWEKENRTFKQKVTMEELASVSPVLGDAIMSKEEDPTLIKLLQDQFPGLKTARAKKALNEMRKNGVAEFPIVRQSVNRPCVEALSPDSDWFFPAYTYDPQRAPYCFWRVKLTAQEIRNKVATEGWDHEWAEYVIETNAGLNNSPLPNNLTQTDNSNTTAAAEDLYEIIYAFQRLTDLEDNSEGIYYTVFHASATGKEGVPAYAKHELLNGYDDYPVVVTKLSEDDKRLYEVLTIPEKLRGCQWQVKVERDSRSDRNSLATVPTIMHPVGQPPPDFGPAVKIPYRRQGEIMFGPTPPYNPGSIELEKTMLQEADAIMGLSLENPLSTQRQQYLVTKFLEHVRDVIKLAFKCYQRFGPPAVGFRVTGSPEFVEFTKGDPNEEFDVIVNFDVLNNDPETAEKRLNAFASLLQFDKNGRIDIDAFLDASAGSIDPILADTFLRPAQEAQQQIVKQVTEDLTKIFAGIEVGARPNGAQIALQVIQQYVQQPDIAERLMKDDAFRERINKYVKQYQFQLQQAQNAQIGRIGTAPAQMGQTNTQTLSQ